MTALGGGEVQRIVSLVAGFALLFAKTQKAQRQDLADLAEALGGSHQVGVEGVLGHGNPSACGVATIRPMIGTGKRILQRNQLVKEAEGKQM
jgi:hypothetical protein